MVYHIQCALEMNDGELQTVCKRLLEDYCVEPYGMLTFCEPIPELFPDNPQVGDWVDVRLTTPINEEELAQFSAEIVVVEDLT